MRTTTVGFVALMVFVVSALQAQSTQVGSSGLRIGITSPEHGTAVVGETIGVSGICASSGGAISVSAVSGPEACGGVDAAECSMEHLFGSGSSGSYLRIRLHQRRFRVATAICDGSKFYTQIDTAEFEKDAPVILIAANADTLSPEDYFVDSVTFIKKTVRPVLTLSAAADVINKKNASAFFLFGTCEDGQQVVFDHGLVSIRCREGRFGRFFDLSDLPDGEIILSASTTNLDRTQTSSLLITKDTKAPELSLSFPMDGSYITSNMAVASGHCDDETAMVTFSDALGNIRCNGESFYKMLDFSPFPENVPLEIVATILDDASNERKDQVVVTKDIHSPPLGINVIDRRVNANNMKSFPVFGVCEGNYPIRFSADIPEIFCNGGSFDTNLDVSRLPDGQMTVSAVTIDDAGHLSKSTFVLEKDVDIPNVEIVSPANDGFVNTDIIEISGNCNDEQSVVSLTGGFGSAACDGERFLVRVDLTKFPEGRRLTLSAIIEDEAANTSYSSVTFTKDTVRPRLTLTSSEDRVNMHNVENFVVSGLCEAGLPIRFIQDIPDIDCPDGSFTVPLDLSLLPDGGQSFITAVTTDKARNSTSRNLFFEKDTTPPMVKILMPKDGSYVITEGVEVSGICDDPSLEIVLSEGFGEATCNGTGFKKFLDLSSFPDNTQITLSASVSDALGNAKDSSVTMIKDTTPPKVGLLASSNLVNAQNVLDFPVSGVCEEGSVIGFGYGLPDIECVGSTFEASLDLSDLPEGTSIIEAAVVDGAGRSDRASIEVHKDSRVPKVEITAPKDGSYIKTSTVMVEGFCDEPGGTVAFSGDLGDTVCDGEAFKAELDFSKFPENDPLALIATVVDDMGNGSSSSVSVVKDTVPPPLTLILANDEVDSLNMRSFAVSGICETGRRLSFNKGIADVDCIGGRFNASLDLSSMPDGKVTVGVSTSDLAGHTAYASFSVDKDSTLSEASPVSLEGRLKSVVQCSLDRLLPSTNEYSRYLKERSLRTLNFVYQRLGRKLEAYGIHSDIEKAHLLAQVMVESRYLTSTVEDIRGKGRDGMLEAGTPTQWDCREYLNVSNDNASFFNRRYGYKADFRGRGLIQLTHCPNYLGFLYHKAAERAGLSELSKGTKNNFFYWDSRGRRRRVYQSYCTEEVLKDVAQDFLNQGLSPDVLEEMVGDFGTAANYLSLPCHGEGLSSMTSEEFVVDSALWYWRRCKSSYPRSTQSSSEIAVKYLSMCVHGQEAYLDIPDRACRESSAEELSIRPKIFSSYCNRLRAFNAFRRCFRNHPTVTSSM